MFLVIQYIQSVTQESYPFFMAFRAMTSANGQIDIYLWKQQTNRFMDRFGLVNVLVLFKCSYIFRKLEIFQTL